MNHYHHEKLRVGLINAGFLDATAKFTPTKNWVALEELSERVQKKLSESASLFVYQINGGQQCYQVILSYKQDEDLVIGFGKDIYEAFCTAALTLPTLFVEHPEYAANNYYDASALTEV